MEKQSKVPTIYGYAVCLVAVITFLIAITAMINSIMDLSDPLHAERNFSQAPSLASFDNYKMDILGSGKSELTYQPDDQTLMNMYEAAKRDKISSVKHRCIRNILVNGLLILICIVLFWTHWVWMKRLNRLKTN